MATLPTAEDIIPTYRIDLARPPELRYVDVAAEFGPRIRTLGHVFDELLEAMLPYRFLAKIAKFAAKVLLRGVYDDEQTKEIKGFAETSGVDLFLIVALNVFLDVLMGCTAGCVRVNAKRAHDDVSTISLMHFRTLDWGVDTLRDLVVVLEYVDTAKDPDHVIATSVTYAGFVGILTGARENLSISLNYRPMHLCSNLALKKHQFLVLLGFRPSISSIIRSTIFNPQQWASDSPDGIGSSSPLIAQAQKLAAVTSSPCYLTLCDGHHGVIIEKDLIQGRIRTAEQFIVQTNHDSKDAACFGDSVAWDTATEALPPQNELWLRDSTDRMDVIQSKWTEHSSGIAAVVDKAQLQGCTGDSINHEKGTQENMEIGAGAVTEGALRDWMKDERISNNFTHFACILDPITGKVRWLERGHVPKVANQGDM
ncbi:hypothetical protein G7046_g8655 [Stylonectria norvegica]|nr:hypothetical protein G7046_g8655 [Stylonectria norvegica]